MSPFRPLLPLAAALFVSLPAVPARAQTVATQAPKVVALEIRPEGYGHTRPSAVLRLMNTRLGEPFDPVTFQRDLVRLRNTGNLYDLRPKVLQADGGVAVSLDLRDRWSLLPFLSFSRGGDRTTTRLGLWDTNTIGRLFTVSAEISSNATIPFVKRSPGDRLGGMVYTDVPRVAGTLVSSAGYVSREFQSIGAWDSSGERLATFDAQRDWLHGDARYEVTDLVTVGFGLGTLKDTYSSRDATVPTLPQNAHLTSAKVFTTVGLIDQDIARYEGLQADATVEGGKQGLFSDESWISLTASGRTFVVPHIGHNLGLQLVFQATTGRIDSLLPHAGGQVEIRGFPANYFVGQRLGRANLEYRLEVLDLRWPFRFRTVWQIAGFVDGGYVASRADAVSGVDYTGPIASAGGGLRITLVPFARSVARIDLAEGLLPFRMFDLSFGAQHFF